MVKLGDDLNDEWKKILIRENRKKQLIEIIKKIKQTTPDSSLISPPKSKWFEWARITHLDDIRVVIIGQDPYPDLKDAHGLSFSSLTRIPSSLKNIYKCLKNTNQINKLPSTGDLTNWAKQGVLMLNIALSTESKEPLKHMEYWKPYTMEIIKNICTYHANIHNKIIFLLWGNFAQSINSIIEKYGNGEHIVMNWRHPSPLAQRCEENLKFINCDHFKKVNEILKNLNKNPINWNPDKKCFIKFENNCIENYKEEKLEMIQEEKLEMISNGKLKGEINVLPYIFYNTNKWIKTDEKLSGKTIRVFTDGSCIPNNRSTKSRGGWSYIITEGFLKGNFKYNYLNRDKFPASNIRAEGEAIYQVLLDLKNSDSDKWETCQIYTDSQFWVKMIKEYMPKWSNEKFYQKKNSDMTIKIWNIWLKLLHEKKDLELIHVYAHDKTNLSKGNQYNKYCYFYNDLADKLANIGRELDV